MDRSCRSKPSDRFAKRCRRSTGIYACRRKCRLCRRCDEGWVPNRVSLTFKVNEVKQLVLLDRAAKRSAELFEFHWLLGGVNPRAQRYGCGVEIVACIEGGVAPIGVR